MELHGAYRQLLFQLNTIYDQREASNIADLVIEHVSGKKKIDRILNKKLLLNDQQSKKLVTFTDKLLQHMPVHYVLHEAWFAGMKFYVDENVLIPRPETEELVDWILLDSHVETHHSQFTIHNSQPTILDIGTGSGCIAIALKKKLPSAQVIASDISEAALNVAKRNALANNTEIVFQMTDILKQTDAHLFELFDIIVSNPPYVKRSEADQMPSNVFLYEPHDALFVPDEDPLLFYKHICDFAGMHLKPNGKIYFEINETLSAEVHDLLESKQFTSIQTRHDLQGKDRMIKATYVQ